MKRPQTFGGNKNGKGFLLQVDNDDDGDGDGDTWIIAGAVWPDDLSKK